MRDASRYEAACALRKKGMSYNAISAELAISKSTLSGWFASMPLSKERILSLRANNPVRIKRFQETMRRKREVRRRDVYERVRKDFENARMTREMYAGYFLYWAEGTKSAPCTVALANSDPNMLVFFVSWIRALGVPRSGLRVKLHVYSDMNIQSVIAFWSNKLAIPDSQFYKPYVKPHSSENRTYKGMFGHGTCTVMYHNRDIYERVMAGIEYLRNQRI